MIRNGVRSMSIIWKSPSTNMVKLNSDGAGKYHKIHGCGGIIRDTRGDWIKEFSKFLENCSAIVAEYWGVLEELKLTKSLGLRIV